MNTRCNSLWQYPNKNINDGEWYGNKPVGHNGLSKMMVEISKEAELSEIYTNHCIRSTCVTALAQAGVEATRICTVTGHKNVQSLESYMRSSSEEQKEELSSILFNYGNSVKKYGNSVKKSASTNSQSESDSRQLCDVPMVHVNDVQPECDHSRPMSSTSDAGDMQPCRPIIEYPEEEHVKTTGVLNYMTNQVKYVDHKSLSNACYGMFAGAQIYGSAKIEVNLNVR